MDPDHILQRLEECQGDIVIFRNLITFASSLDSLDERDTNEWQLILLYILDILSRNEDIGKECILLASQAFSALLSTQCTSESFETYFIYFLNLDSHNFHFMNKTYNVSDPELFKLIIIHGYLQVNHKKIRYNNIFFHSFDIIYRNSIQYTRYSYFAYKVLYIWLKRTLDTDFWNTNSITLEQQLEEIIFSNWCNAVNELCKQNASIFNTYLIIMSKKYSRFLEFLFEQCVDKISWQNEKKYIILAEICNVWSNLEIITSKNFLLCLCTSLINHHLRSGGTKVYMNILKKIDEETWKKSFSDIVKFIVYQWELGSEQNYDALQTFCKYWLEPTVGKYKNILIHLWDLYKDMKTHFFNSYLQRLASEMHVLLPQRVDFAYYIHNKNEIIRLNGFAINCYEVNELLDINKANPFFNIQQFLWYNANSTTIFMREGIIKYFKIFCVRLSKISENLNQNQHICHITEWLYEYILDCLESGSCYQRKILGLNLYNILLSFTNRCLCQHTIKYTQYKQCVHCIVSNKIDKKWNFVQRKDLLALLKITLDTELDIKQLAISIIINYFDKNTLTEADKKVLFNVALDNCNSFKFYEVESGATLMKVLTIWEPLPKRFTDFDNYKENSIYLKYIDLFLYKAEMQLLLIKEDLLKAIVQRTPLYGTLTVILYVGFRKGTENNFLTSDFINKMLHLLEDVVNFLISILSSKSENTEYLSSFSEMGLAIDETIKSSAIMDDNYDELNLSPAHQVIISCIWMSLKVSCEIASEIGILMYSDTIVQRSINLIIMVLTKCRHKGAIEAAGTALGILTRCLCKNEKYIHLLKKYITTLLEDTKNNVNVTRRGAGFSIMFHKIIVNDNRTGRPLLHFAVQTLLHLLEITPGVYPKSIVYSYDLPCAKYLYFLRTLVADKEIHAQLTPYMEQISLVCFKHLQSKIWIIRNASLQLFGVVIPRLMGQSVGGKGLDFGNGSSVNHFITHYPKLLHHIILKLREISHISKQSNIILHAHSSVVPILILLSKLSVDAYDLNDYSSKILTTNIKNKLHIFLGSPIGYVRLLTAKAYAALTEFSHIRSELSIIKAHILVLRDANFIHGYLLTTQYLKEKFIIEAQNLTLKKEMLLSEYNQWEQYINLSRSEHILNRWYNRTKNENDQSVNYILETMFLQISNSKISSENITIYHKCLEKSISMLNSEKTKPGFYQFLDILICLYADFIKCTGIIDEKIFENILCSEPIQISINFLNRINNSIPLLKTVLKQLSLTLINGHTLLLDTMITFIINTMNNSMLIKIYELKIEDIATDLSIKIKNNTPYINLLHLKYALTAIFYKDEKVINKVLFDILNICVTESEHVRNTSAECVLFFIKRFAEFGYKNKLAVLHCCLILLKDDIFEIRDLISTNVQMYIIPIICGSLHIPRHNEFIYQRLLLEVVFYTSKSKFLYSQENLILIQKFVLSLKNYTGQTLAIETPFDQDKGSTYREESKFLNLFFFFIQYNKKYDDTDRLSNYNKLENSIDFSHLIQSKYQFLEKININFNDLKIILNLKCKDYLSKKKEIIIQECNFE